MGCNCTKKKLIPSGKKIVKKTSRPTTRASVKPTRRIARASVKSTRRIVKRTTR